MANYLESLQRPEFAEEPYWTLREKQVRAIREAEEVRDRKLRELAKEKGTRGDKSIYDIK